MLLLRSPFVIPASLIFLVLALGISGCQSTILQQKRAELVVLQDANAASQQTLAGFRNGTLPGYSELHLYFSYGAVNRALAALDDYTFSLPSDPSILVTVGQIRLGAAGSLPVVSVRAKAARGSLTADVDMRVIAVPASVPGALKLKVLSFVPIIEWGAFEVTKAAFVRALLGRKSMHWPSVCPR